MDFFVYVVFNIFAAKEMVKIINIMTDDCKAQECIDIHIKLLGRKYFIRKKAWERIKTFLLLNLSSGFLHLGKSAAARQALDCIDDEFPNNSFGAFNKVSYYNNLFVYYLQVKDISNASESLEQMRLSLENKKLKKRLRDSCFSSYSDKCFLLNIANGEYDGAEQVFNNTFEREKAMLKKVIAKYTLGKIYLHYNKIDEAKNAFEYVIKNGGDTHYVNEARQILNEITPAT